MVQEMVTGRRLFAGASSIDVLHAVLHQELDWTGVPPAIEPLLRACVQRDPAQRLHDLADMRFLTATQPVQVAARRLQLWPVIAGVGVLGAAIAIALQYTRANEPALTAMRFQVPPPSGAIPAVTSFPAFSFSPDGRSLVFSATGGDNVRRLWIHTFATGEARPLAGTDGSARAFWSPDGRSIAFGAGQRLRRLSLDGGPPQRILEAGAGSGGGAWNRNNVIVLNDDKGGLSQTTANGGAMTPLIAKLPDELHAELPQFLPDGTHFLYFRHSANNDIRGIWVGSIDTKPEDQPRVPLLLADDGPVLTAAAGRPMVLFLREHTLYGQSLDVNGMRLNGEPIRIADDVVSALGNGLFSASPTGVLAYWGGETNPIGLTWLDRSGNVQSSSSLPRGTTLRLSPDGNKAIVEYDNDQDLWLVDFTSGSRTRVTTEPGIDRAAVWSSSGTEIIFQAVGRGIYRAAVNGTRPPQPVMASSLSMTPESWSPGNDTLLYTSEARGSDIFSLTLGERKTATPLLTTAFNERHPHVSPDGQWLAYESDETGMPEVYVRRFPLPPDGGERRLISRGGGRNPQWRGDGRELFYLAPQDTMMSVDIMLDENLTAGPPKTMFTSGLLGYSSTGEHRWAPSPDGERFAIISPVSSMNRFLGVIVNWPSLLPPQR